MAKQIVLSGRELLRILEKLGFVVTRINGSHYRMKHSDGRITTIAIHGNNDLPKGTFRKIVRDDLEMEMDEFLALYEKYK